MNYLWNNFEQSSSIKYVMEIIHGNPGLFCGKADLWITPQPYYVFVVSGHDSKLNRNINYY